MKKAVFLILFIFFTTTVCCAGDSDKAIEKKKEAIMNIMNKGQFKAYIQADQKFCATFLSDFSEQKNIEHIKPIMEVDDYNDPRLQTYFKQCSSAEFQKHTWIEPRGHYEMARDYYATKNFKLFRVDLDNNKKNSDELVLYAEGFKDAGNNYTYGGYSVINLKKCKITYGVPTNDSYDYQKQQPIENYNGVIKYKGEYYVFDLYVDPARRLVLEKYNSKRGMMLSICRYRLHE